MKVELRKLSIYDDMDVYRMLQTIPEDENGFENHAFGLSFEEFKQWLQLQDDYAHGLRLMKGWVPQTQYWLYIDDIPVGNIRLRHRLTPALLMNGGHIGYAIAPAYRGHAYAQIMLKEIIKIAHMMKIDQVLITPRTTTIASRKTIEYCGGKLEKEEHGYAYYWLTTD